MDIYKISTDFSFKNITAKEGVTKKFYHYQGQPLSEKWEPPAFGLLENLARLKSEINADRKLRGDFDARCYGNMFLLKETFVPALQNLPLEFLPVIVEHVEEKFVCVNVLKIIEAINFQGLDFKQSMDMMKSNTARFISKNIGQHIIFRDQKLINSYYCSQPFIDQVNQHNIKGLRFDKAGETT